MSRPRRKFKSKLLRHVLRAADAAEVEHLAGDAAEHVADVVGDGLEVRGGVVGAGDEHAVVLAAAHGLEGFHDGVEALHDVAEEADAGLELRHGVRRLHRGAHDGDEAVLRRHLVLIAEEGNVDVVVAARLAHGHDDLAAVAGDAADGVVQDADGARHAARGPHLLGGEVARVAHDAEPRLGGAHLVLELRLDAPGHAVRVGHDLLHVAVEHEGAAVDGAEPREGLGQAAEAPHGVEVGAAAVLLDGARVQLQRAHRLDGGALQVAVVAVQRHGVAHEGLRVRVEVECVEERSHGHVHHVLALPRGGVVLLVLGDVDDEGAEAAFLEHAHERRRDGLLRRRRHLLHLAVLHHERPRDLLELQVRFHARVHQDLHERAAGHDELGHEVDVVVAVGAERRARVLRHRLRELAEELVQRQRRAVAAVVAVAVHVEHLHVHAREQAAHDAVREAGAHDDGVVLAVGEHVAALGQPLRPPRLLPRSPP
mmetsp:Transcript_31846/g.101320  ORF Transcript_31846/g.101320 Transcript_31846/m.101320 type:complete len:483 (-) Transcript_31846:66-1514(-)